MIGLLVFFFLYFCFTFLGLFLLFKKAKVENSWRAFVPVWNFMIVRTMTKKNPYWAFLTIVPFFNLFFTIVYSISFIYQFGKIKWHEHALAVCFLPVYLIYLGCEKSVHFLGYKYVEELPKKKVQKFFYDLVYAVGLVMFVNAFVLQSYVIPTPSMEKSMLVGDKLFVTKFDYGIRIPQTPLSFPLVHNTMPVTGAKSYTELISLPYIRWGHLGVSRGDVAVFNFPMDDTSINREGFLSVRTYYEECRLMGRDYVLAHPDEYPLIFRPVDKKENFVKRVVAVGGDVVQIKDAQLFINGNKIIYEGEQYSYYIITDGTLPDVQLLKQTLEIDWDNFMPQAEGAYYAFLTPQDAEKLKTLSFVKEIILLKEDWQNTIIKRNAYTYSSRPFPYDTTQFKWARDEYGPIWIPKKGAHITLNDSTLTLYGRVIATYEGNELKVSEGKYFINGVAATTYTFKMDYFWLMGDNRHNSLDSRYWGFVPEDHIVGRAAMIWFSTSTKGDIRWERIFKFIR